MSSTRIRSATTQHLVGLVVEIPGDDGLSNEELTDIIRSALTHAMITVHAIEATDETEGNFA